MRKEYNKVLKSLFTIEMKQVAPQFKEEKVTSKYFWPSDRAYRWKAKKELFCWIILSPSLKGYEEFTILIGWSMKGRYPELSMVPCVDGPFSDRKEFKNKEYLIRLPSLWTSKDEWWVIKKLSLSRTIAQMKTSLKPIPAEKAEKAVSPLIQDSIAKIKMYGIPYLEELIHVVSNNKANK